MKSVKVLLMTFLCIPMQQAFSETFYSCQGTGEYRDYFVGGTVGENVSSHSICQKVAGKYQSGGDVLINATKSKRKEDPNSKVYFKDQSAIISYSEYAQTFQVTRPGFNQIPKLVPFKCQQVKGSEVSSIGHITPCQTGEVKPKEFVAAKLEPLSEKDLLEYANKAIEWTNKVGAVLPAAKDRDLYGASVKNLSRSALVEAAIQGYNVEKRRNYYDRILSQHSAGQSASAKSSDSN